MCFFFKGSLSAYNKQTKKHIFFFKGSLSTYNKQTKKPFCQKKRWKAQNGGTTLGHPLH